MSIAKLFSQKTIPAITGSQKSNPGITDQSEKYPCYYWSVRKVHLLILVSQKSTPAIN
ncbi:hypothetical protein BgiMline_029765, partial [Biomphalaria glabrata]